MWTYITRETFLISAESAVDAVVQMITWYGSTQGITEQMILILRHSWTTEMPLRSPLKKIVSHRHQYTTNDAHTYSVCWTTKHRFRYTTKNSAQTFLVVKPQKSQVPKMVKSWINNFSICHEANLTFEHIENPKTANTGEQYFRLLLHAFYFTACYFRGNAQFY